MPQVFVYIRNEDIESWKSIDKKSAFVHDAILKHHLEDKIGIKHDYEKSKEVTTRDIDRNIKSSELKIPGTVKGKDFIPKPLIGECLRHHVDKSICHCD